MKRIGEGIAAAILLVAFVTLWLTRFLLGRERLHAGRTVTIAAPPTTVFALASDVRRLSDCICSANGVVTAKPISSSSGEDAARWAQRPGRSSPSSSKTSSNRTSRSKNASNVGASSIDPPESESMATTRGSAPGSR
jgi:hypothetical protein